MGRVRQKPLPLFENKEEGKLVVTEYPDQASI
jgi:hypothetical protein